MKAQVFQVVMFIAMALLIFFGVRAAIESRMVEQTSMLQTLHPGDRLVVVKAAYWFGDPGRGDVIIFRKPITADEDPEHTLVKRVIGLPGDTIECKDGIVYINGSPLAEPYVYGATYDFAATVPEGCYFVMGDNRQGSSDSRVFGSVPRQNVIGRVWLRYWPLSDWQLLHGYSYSLD
jgi:signal peptidase I